MIISFNHPHTQVLSPILIRRNMQTHHPVNYQLNHSLNHPLNHNLINTFNHGHHNFSINTSQTQPHTSPIIFHHPTAQPPPNLQTNQPTTTQQRQTMHTTGLLELVDQNLNSLNSLNNNTRFNQRNPLINGHLAEHCVTNFCGPNSIANSSHSNGTNLVNQLNGQLLNGNTNSTNCNSINQSNYQRAQQQQQNSPTRQSPSRHRFNRNNRWPRFLNNNYQANLHLSSNSSNNHPIIHTNRPNTLVYSPTVQAPLSPLVSNLTPSAANNNNNLFGVQQQASPNGGLFASNGLVDSLYTNDSNCTNSLTNLANLNSLSNSNQSTGPNVNYHSRRFNNITNNPNRTRSRANNLPNSNMNSNVNLNAFNLLNSNSPAFINNAYSPNLVPMSNLHQHTTNNNYFINNNLINEQQLQLMRLIAILDNNTNALQILQNNGLHQVFSPVLYHNLNMINNPDFIRILSQLSNNVANTGNHFHQLPTHYSNQYFHHNNASNPNTASGSNSNGSNSNTSTLQQQEQNYEALLSLAHRLGEAKTRGLTKQEIDLLPSYKYRSSCSKSIKSFKSKQRTNSKSMKLCKHHSNHGLNSSLNRRLDSNNNLNSIQNSTTLHSEEEELYDELDELENDLAKKDKLLTKDDKLIGKRSKCIRLNDDELDECCDNFVCENDQDEDEKMLCVICMCDFEIKQVLRVLPCNHEYHAR